MSNPPCHPACMKTMRLIEWIRENEAEVITLAGQTRLVRHQGGKFEFLDGTPEERAKLRDWASKFLSRARLPATDS